MLPEGKCSILFNLPSKSSHTLSCVKAWNLAPQHAGDSGSAISYLRKQIKDTTDCPTWDLALLPLLLEELPASLVENLALLHTLKNSIIHERQPLQ